MVGAKKKRPSANTQLPPLDVVVGVWLRCRKTKKSPQTQTRSEDFVVSFCAVPLCTGVCLYNLGRSPLSREKPNVGGWGVNRPVEPGERVDARKRLPQIYDSFRSLAVLCQRNRSL